MLKIEYVKTTELSPYANNAKLHPAEQIEQIKKSIQEFGFNDPIAIWKDNEVIEGHGRLIAANELGLEQVPVIRLDNLSDEERRAYMLVHNQLTMNTGFDFALLEEELADLDIDMTEFGFSNTEIESFFDDEPEETEQENQTKYKVVCICNSEEEKSNLIEWCEQNNIQCEG